MRTLTRLVLVLGVIVALPATAQAKPRPKPCHIHYIRKHGRCGKMKQGGLVPPTIVVIPKIAEPSPPITLDKVGQVDRTVIYQFGVGPGSGEGQLALEANGTMVWGCAFNTEAGMTRDCAVTYATPGPQTVTARFLSVRYGRASVTRTIAVEPLVRKVTEHATWGVGGGDIVTATGVPTREGATVTGAMMTLTAPTYQGAQAVGLSDTRGPSCEATVIADTTATCRITDAELGKELEQGLHPELTLAYPGGATTTVVCPTSGGFYEERVLEWAAALPKIEVFAPLPSSFLPFVSPYRPCEGTPVSTVTVGAGK